MMTNIPIKTSPKQREALKVLSDKETTELFYGGGAGGGKSVLGCIWLIQCCLQYSGVRYLMGRAHLKTLKDSTLMTFFRIAKESFQLTLGKEYIYNAMEGRIKFHTGSEIFLKDLFLYPSDPEFDSLGSTEYTGAFIDECSEITEKAKNIVMSRLRYKLDEFGLIPKLLMASNPTKNFAYREYWSPWKEGTLPPYRKFIPALVNDNKYISPHYAENLKKLDKNSRERLLYGNWNYDDDPSRLFDYDKLCDIFTNKPQGSKNRYISCDVARFGSDKTIVMVWDGLHVIKIYSNVKQSTKQTRLFLEQVSNKFEVPRSNIIIDEDGVGGGVVDEMAGVKGFVNNSKPIETEIGKKRHNFANLKSQCYFYLADKVSEGKLSCVEISPEIKKYIIEDLEQIKWKEPDKDSKVAVTPKEEIKENIGRSPDFGDAMMMRMYFELRPTRSFHIA